MIADRIPRGTAADRVRGSPADVQASSEEPAEQQVTRARAAHAARPDDPRTLFQLVALLLKMGDPDAAILLPDLERHAGFAGGWLAIGDVLLAKGQVGGALTAVGRGIRALPSAQPPAAQAGAAYQLLGRTLRAAGRDADAAIAFENAVRAAPHQAEAWYSLALLRQDQNLHAEAAAAYRHALTVRPDFHEAALNLGVALGECGQLEAALDAYGLALSLRPESFGRIAQSLVSGRTGLLVLDPAQLHVLLRGRTRPF